MGQVVALVSGKGGTGKTTLCAGIAACLAAEGQRVLCLDADVGLRNLDISLGMMSQPMISFVDVLHEHYSLEDAAEHPMLPGLFLLTAPIRENVDLISQASFQKLLNQIREKFDWCLIDSPAGIGAGFQLASHYADQLIMIATADPSSLRDAGAAADLLSLDGISNIRLVVNRVKRRALSRISMTVDDLMDGIGLPLLGLVPEDAEVPVAARKNQLLILEHSRGASVAFLHIARRLRGQTIPLMRL